MTLPHSLAVVGEAIAEVTDTISVDGFHLEPRCRVCRNDEVRKKVNDLLARGASYASIVRALEDDNAMLDKRDRVTIDSVRNHTARHFPVQNMARATYRDILERRAKENGIDFVDGVATAITPMALYETVMAKGYENLVDPDTEVDINTAMVAAGRLQAVIDSRSHQPDIAKMMVQMNRIIGVVRSTVPTSLWPELERKLDEIDESDDHAPDESDEMECEEDDVFDPGDIDDFDDEDDF